MKKNGFTLVELLAMLVVLGILMGVAIPNISGIIKNNKLNIIKADVVKMIDTAKVKMSTDKAINQKPTHGQCIVMALNYLNVNEDINTGPNGGKYLLFDSFVVITREDTLTSKKYKYYVRLIEQTGNQQFGVDLIERTKLTESNSDYIQKITDKYDLDGGSQKMDDDKEILREKLRDKCENGIIGYYPGDKLK